MQDKTKRFISLRHQFALGVAIAMLLGLSGMIYLLVDSYRAQREQLVEQIQSTVDQSLDLHLSSLFHSISLAVQFDYQLREDRHFEQISSELEQNYPAAQWLIPLENICIDNLGGDPQRNFCVTPNSSHVPDVLLTKLKLNLEPSYVLDCDALCTMWVGVPIDLKDGRLAAISLKVGLQDQLIMISRQLNVAIEIFIHEQESATRSIGKFGDEQSFPWLEINDASQLTAGSSQKFEVIKRGQHSYVSHSVEKPLTSKSSVEFVFVKQWDKYDSQFGFLVLRAFIIGFAALLLSIFCGYFLTAGPLKLLLQHVQQLPQILENRRYQANKIRRSFRDEFDSLDSASLALVDEVSSMRSQILATHKKLVRQARTDSLTGLGNRYAFSDILSEHLSSFRDSSEPFFLVYIDIDNFKAYNDGFGHAFGDQLLIQIVERMKNNLPKKVRLFRIGSDEFQLIVPYETDLRVFQAINELKHLIAVEMNAGLLAISVHVSVGIARAKQANFELTTILKHADLALQSAKAKGRNRIEFFEPALEEAQELLFSVETQFQAAMDNDELELFLQPQVSCQQQKVLGFELLLRWNHPTKGLLAPGQFLDVIENSRYVLDLGYWVIRKTLEIMCRFESLGYLDLSFALNVSPKQFEDDNFAKNLIDIYQSRTCKTNTLEIELTESCAVNDFERVSKALKVIRHQGIHVALDDFGKGFTSLSYLSHLPCDKVKFDREFCMDAMHNPRSEEILLNAKSLVEIIEAKVLVEGIEEMEYAQWLGERGFDLLQGYVFGKPLPQTEAMSYLDQVKIDGKI
ncbi:EAL domain-containing protein [Alginatibacterium sediminis]|uniref:EAL domain-containing protein n=1 Tax=Alginatibacterium sediminis TaxID=2164068 RepID=A0A420E7P1_9ALTE|nr:EAL domain-containing protein [Alginatibacterium sediminis]RKF15559.1 EAL domain-containing protein [Alginatibacterium sediminis]